jgi:DNA-binding NtrC family response regulator
MSSILLVDDESMVLDVLSQLLTMNGHTVTATDKPREAFELIDGQYFDVYVFDLRMPEYTGTDLAKHTRHRHPSAKILIITAFPGDSLAVEAMRSGVTALVKKPFEIGKILSFLDDEQQEEPSHAS